MLTHCPRDKGFHEELRALCDGLEAQDTWDDEFRQRALREAQLRDVLSRRCRQLSEEIETHMETALGQLQAEGHSHALTEDDLAERVRLIPGYQEAAQECAELEVYLSTRLYCEALLLGIEDFVAWPESN